MPLPDELCETGRVFTPRVDRYGQIPVRTNRYSVPIRLIGKRVRVVLHASHLVVYDQNVEVARHERLIAKGAVRLDLDHYLEVLLHRPRTGPLRRQVHLGPRRLVGPGPQDPRRARRHPGSDRGPPAGASSAPRACRRRPGRGLAGRGHDR
ncbi:Mu transposase domain-containing protein [Streptomyces paludis]|uniref:Mu transposase domain-containing protein n=1 Tax=Streptomyces paludis TaxID=2282738 RepID=UPI0038B674FC